MKNNRLKQIQAYLELHGSVDISTLSRKLNVSEMTIRRDLNVLVNQAKAVRTHGGAILPREHYVGDIYMDSRIQVKAAEKRAIAREAVSSLHPGDSVYIDDGSTVNAMVQFIPYNIQLRVTTASMWAALEFNKFPNIEVVTLGGIVSKTTKSAGGSIALEVLQDMYFNTAFISVPYISASGLATTYTIDEVSIKKHVIAQSQRSILLMDSSKLRPEPLNLKIASIEDFDLIITDDQIDPDFLTFCLSKNVSIQTVKV